MGPTLLADRQVSADRARAIAETGGSWAYGVPFRAENYVGGLKEMADTVGVDHVSIGNDQIARLLAVIISASSSQLWDEEKEKTVHVISRLQRPVLPGPFRRTAILTPSAPAWLCDANLTFSPMLLMVEIRREEIEGV